MKRRRRRKPSCCLSGLSGLQTELKALMDCAERQGWRKVRKRDHIAMYSPDGKHILGFPTHRSGGARTYQNTKAEFKRAGLNFNEC